MLRLLSTSVRLALTGAIVVAVALRLRRPAPPRRPTSRELGLPEPLLGYPDEPPRGVRGRRPVLLALTATVVVALLVTSELFVNSAFSPAARQSTQVTWEGTQVTWEGTQATWEGIGPPEALCLEGDREARRLGEEMLVACLVDVAGEPEHPTPQQETRASVGPAEETGCAPERRAVAVRAVDPAVRQAVNRQWRRIERWLREHAPRTFESLGRPARAATIAVAEAQMGLDFPDALRASLLRHNGGGEVFPHYDDLLTVRGIRDTWRVRCEQSAGDGFADDGVPWWDGRMIPFAGMTYDNGESMDHDLVVDSRDGSLTGFDGDEGGLVSGDLPPFEAAGSYFALLRTTADALERGSREARPVVVRGRLTWE